MSQIHCMLKELAKAEHMLSEACQVEKDRRRLASEWRRLIPTTPLPPASALLASPSVLTVRIKSDKMD
jgi:hypothetical protein